MAAKFSTGQKVKIKPSGGKALTPRDAAIDEFAGQDGEITNYFWLNPRGAEVFYLYKVRVGKQHSEIAVYEDEIEAV